MRYEMDLEEVEDFSLFESTFVKEETELEENEKTGEKCPILAESSVMIKQEIDEEEEEDSVLFESLLVKEETNLGENYKVRDLSPFSSVIVKEEVREDNVQDYDEDKEETENTFEINTPSTIKQEPDYEQEKKLFPFESVFIKEEREDEEEICGYDDERKTENNNDIPEAISGAVVDVFTNGDVAQRMRARFRSILFRRMPVAAGGSASTSVSTVRNFVDRSGVGSGLVQTKCQPPRGGPFQCGECGMGFKNEQNMWMHEFACKENAAVSRAEALKWSECPQCPALLPPAVLADHLALHSDDLFCCDVCGLVFFSLCRLINHKTRHDKLHLRFRCGECGRAFPLLSSLRRHQHRHATESPVAKCPQCPKSFRYAWILRRHRLAHARKKTQQRYEEEEKAEKMLGGREEKNNVNGAEKEKEEELESEGL